MKCIKCGETRESEFYPSAHRRCDYRCKLCISKATKLWKDKNPERWRASQLEYRKNNRICLNEYMRNHPELNKKNFKKWYENNADKHYERRLAYARANPQRHNAQGLAWLAYPEAQVCEVMGCFELGERHHDDYNHPYEIRWLCRKHHKLLHRDNKLPAEIIPLNL